VRFPFTPEARAQLRAIDRPVALRILESIAHFGEAGSGDVESCTANGGAAYRLRVGEYRVIFRYIEDGLEILTVGHRSDVYK
jgi:mRNA interferase RelE/StbE